MGPNECKYCGCDKFNADSVTMTRFRCGSSYWPQDEMWQVANGCAAKCAVQLVELRERVQRAVEVLEKAERHEMVIDQNGDIDWVDIPEGTMMLSAPANEATAILKGEEDDESD